jgi:ketosteroid isomerase-like protein
MKVVLGAGVFALVCAVGLAAQGGQMRAGQAKAAPAMDKAAIEKAIIANEQAIDAAFKKGDPVAFKALIADDAVSVDEGGATPIAEFVKMFKDIKVTEATMTGFKVQWVDANTAILTYTWTGKGTFMGQAMKSPTYASTVWNKRGDKWLAVFHQETLAAPAPPKK